jgi:hypothetical protein
MSVDWLTVSETGGTGNKTVSVCPSVNTDPTSARSATIYIMGDNGNIIKTVSVYQAQAPLRLVSIYFAGASDVMVSYTGGSVSYSSSRYMVKGVYNDGTERQIGDVTITGTSFSTTAITTAITETQVGSITATATYSGSSATTTLSASTTVRVMQQPVPESNRIVYNGRNAISFTQEARDRFGANIIYGGISYSYGIYVFDGPVLRFDTGGQGGMITLDTRGNLTSIDVPSSLTKLGQDIFLGCSALTTVNGLENTQNVYVSPEPPTSSNTFKGCTNLVHCGLPYSYQYTPALKPYMFTGCTSLVTIIYNGTVAEWNAITKNSNWKSGSAIRYIRCSDGTVDLDSNAITYKAPSKLTIDLTKFTPTADETGHTFSNGYGRIAFPTTLNIVGMQAFDSQADMTAVYLPAGVQRLNDRAFYGCAYMTEISLPSSLSRIEAECFTYCYSLTTITFQGTKSQWNSISKSSLWKTNSTIQYVDCVDGTITL